MTGISRKLPDTERARLKKIMRQIIPEDAGVIVRTAAEGASEEELTRDVERLRSQWEKIQKAQKSKSAPAALSQEPDRSEERRVGKAGRGGGGAWRGVRMSEEERW